MKIYTLWEHGKIYSQFAKYLIIMKIVAFLIFVSIIQVHASSYAQRVTLSKKNASLIEVLRELKQQTDYNFICSAEIIKETPSISINVRNVSIEDALRTCFPDGMVSWEILKKNVILKKEIIIHNQPVTESNLMLGKKDNQQPITGRVFDEADTPLAGATIRVKGKSQTTQTNNEGVFGIEAKENDVLLISFTGFETKEVVVLNASDFTIHLTSMINAMEEVTVVGYGTQKKSSLTSAVSDIKGDALTKRPVASAVQALQGLAPGVSIRDIGGAPGKANANIRIRGITTLGNNDPLTIVDGIEQNFADINPADIESISVLKDAASTAIYGSRAANGVVLVTTKRASSGELLVNYDGYYAIQNSLFHPKHMGLEETLRMKNVAAVNVGAAQVYTEQEIQDWVNATDRYKYPLPNVWFDYLLKPAPQQNHTLTLSGGNQQLRTLLSINYFDQDGIIPQSEGNKMDIRLNTDFKVSERITLSADFNYRVNKYLSPLNETSVFRYMLHGSNFAVPRYPDGTYGLGSESYSPLVTDLLDGRSNFSRNYGLLNLKADIKLFKGLKFQAQYAGRFQQFYQKDFANAYEIRDYYNSNNVLKKVSTNSLTETRNTLEEFTLNSLLIYETNIEEHSLNALLGYSQILNEEKTLFASRNDFYNNDVQSISQGSDASRDNGGADLSWGLRSYFGRVTYNYSEKYFFEANGRYDGSSRFTGNNKYSFFPSFSGAWRISQEPFWASVSTVVDEFKVRGSWGKSGNQTVPLYSYFETLSASNYNFDNSSAQGIALSTLANRNLTWETTTQSDLGVDVQFFKGKFGMTFDYFEKRTDGILLTLPIPAVVGLNPPSQNAGVVENKGWELSLTHRSSIKELRYSITGNISDVQNKIVSLEGTGPYISGTTGNTLTVRQEGYPIDAYFGFQSLGIFQSKEEVEQYPVFDPATSAGDIKYADINQDGKITTADLAVIGSDIPRFTFGLNTNLQYDGFDVNIFFQGVGKANAIPEGALRQMGNWGAFALDMQTDYWTPENPGAEFPRPLKEKNINSQMSDFWMINTAYLKLKNLQIGYTFPSTFTDKIQIKRMRMYVSGSNLFTISKATKYGLDPEFPSGRVAYYPQLALYTVGVNVTF